MVEQPQEQRVHIVGGVAADGRRDVLGAQTDQIGDAAADEDSRSGGDVHGLSPREPVAQVTQVGADHPLDQGIGVGEGEQVAHRGPQRGVPRSFEQLIDPLADHLGPPVPGRALGDDAEMRAVVVDLAGHARIGDEPAESGNLADRAREPPKQQQAGQPGLTGGE
ncbi:MAG TPA: hypothetical protein VK083_07475 [Nocardia sp.]|uniref:hypothetical protein n=1 Tax=Nocardia sp. TaxID=1821 RepID=UPI002B4B71CE|nr:hypothetical protein [Nocardia sp.]HLS76610.1 hypothetical protein [Nocardia sp.]